MPSPGMTARRISARLRLSPRPSRPASPANAAPRRALPASRAAAAPRPAHPRPSPPLLRIQGPGIQGPVDGADERVQRRGRDAGVDAASPEHAAVNGDLEVGGRLGLLA